MKVEIRRVLRAWVDDSVEYGYVFVSDSFG